ncbi:MAG TPA: LacI family DNA-binding transcriptional regulator [Thermoanaerobaculia bacterium]|nr:LacI family DNA-binding transcriptional regulator [Thermoanaerobaculia bacterium]
MTPSRRTAPGSLKAGRRVAPATAAGVTIREVAQAAGVSVATVSRVVNGTTVVKDETRLRVEAEVTRLRYSPHAAARSLITNRTNTVGVVLPDIWGEYFSEVIRGIDLSARQAGYHVLVSSSHSDVAETRDVLRTMHGRVDGVIVMSPHASPRELGGSLPLSLPVVFLNSAPGGPQQAAINVDNRGGARAMVAHLLGLGHRRLAFVTGPASNFDSSERRRGCREALRAEGLAPEAVTEIEGDFGEESGQAAGEAILRISPRPTAIFAANDSMAIGVLFALRRAGARVPEEIAVAGFDDIPIARFASPPLSTVRHDIRTLGERALARLLAEISGEGALHTVREVLPIRLVLRESTGDLDGDARTGPPRAAFVSQIAINSSTVRRRKAS